jgi:hypothetical protein
MKKLEMLWYRTRALTREQKIDIAKFEREQVYRHVAQHHPL